MTPKASLDWLLLKDLWWPDTRRAWRSQNIMCFVWIFLLHFSQHNGSGVITWESTLFIFLILLFIFLHPNHIQVYIQISSNQPYLQRSNTFFVSFWCLFIYVFWERERGSTSRGRTEREGEREYQAGSALSVNPEIMTWAEIKSQTLNQLSHQTPREATLLLGARPPIRVRMR